MPPFAPPTVESDVEPWLLPIMRQNLFKEIRNEGPYANLQRTARSYYGSRGLATTPLEIAEQKLNSMIKEKANFSQLQKQLKQVGELELQEQNDEEAKTTKNTTSDGLLSNGEDAEPSNKKRGAALRVVDDNDDNPAPPDSKRRVISRATKEPFRPKQLRRQAQLQAATDAEIARDLDAKLNGDLEQEASDAEIARQVQADEMSLGPDTTGCAETAQKLQDEFNAQHAGRVEARSNSQAGRPRPRVQNSESGSDTVPRTIGKKKKAGSLQNAHGYVRVSEEEDDINYDADDGDASPPPRLSQGALAHQIALDEELLGLKGNPRATSSNNAAKKSDAQKQGPEPARKTTSYNQRAPGASVVSRGGRVGQPTRQSNDSDADDDSEDDLPERSGVPPRHRATTRNQSALASSDASRGSRDSEASRNLMPPPAAPRVSIRRDAQESDALTYRRAEIAHRGAQNALNRVPTPLPASRLPRGSPSEDDDTPMDDAPYGPEPDRTGRRKVFEENGRRYFRKNGKKYWVVRTTRRIQVRDESNNIKSIDYDHESNVSVPSDTPAGCNSPPPFTTKIKLNGRQGEPWDPAWAPQPDPEPKGARGFAVPVGEAFARPRLPDVELARKKGMESGKGSEYIYGVREGPGSQPGVGMGGGSVMGSMGPPSSYTPASLRYSVKEGHKVNRNDPKHDRSVSRLTTVESMRGDRDDPPLRNTWLRQGLNEDGTPIVEDGQITAPLASSAPQVSGGRGLTMDNIAILEAQTGQPRTAQAVVYGKQRAVAAGDDDRATWNGDFESFFGNETPRRGRTESVSASESLHAASLTIDRNRSSAPSASRSARDLTTRQAYPSSRHGPIRDPRDEDNDEDDRAVSVAKSQRELELEAENDALRRRQMDQEVGIWRSSSVTGMEQFYEHSSQYNRRGHVPADPRDAEGSNAPRLGGPASSNGGSNRETQQGGYGRRGVGHGGGGYPFGRNNRGGRGGGGSNYGGSQRNGGGPRKRQQEDPNAEYDRMKRESERLYPFREYQGP